MISENYGWFDRHCTVVSIVASNNTRVVIMPAVVMTGSYILRYYVQSFQAFSWIWVWLMFVQSGIESKVPQSKNTLVSQFYWPFQILLIIRNQMIRPSCIWFFFLNSQHKTQAGSIHNIYPKCIHIQLSKNHIYFINSKNFIRREYIALLQMRLCHHDYCRVLSKQYNSSIRTKKYCWMSYSSASLSLAIFCNQLFCLFF